MALLKVTGVIVLTLMLEVNGHALRAKRFVLSISELCPYMPIGTGTTPYLEQIFIGRCWEYQYQYNTKKDNCPGARIDCFEVLRRFKSAFVGKDQCNINDDAYDDLLNLIPIQFAEDRTLFWIGRPTNRLANGYAVARSTAYTMEVSMLGYIIDGLNWCSTQGSDQFSSDPCPDFNSENCTSTATGVFWAAASIMLAKQASGIVSVMVNGSSPSSAFSTGSFFAKYELPNLDPDKVTLFRIVVAHTIGGPINEECGTESIKLLKDLAAARGLTYTCENSPRDLRFFQCVDNIYHKECQPESIITTLIPGTGTSDNRERKKKKQVGHSQYSREKGRWEQFFIERDLNR